MPSAALIAGGLIAALAVAGSAWVRHNTRYDRSHGHLIARAGFTEKQALLPDGTVINYGEGPNNGPPLLLIHGQMTTWEDYARALPRLSKSFHVFAPDCHGHGESSRRTEKYTAVAMGADLAWFIRHIIGEAAVVSGHSSGGLLAAWLAANAPDAVRGMVIEDAPLFATEAGRREATFAWLGFKLIHDFLHQEEEVDYTRYYLEHSYLSTMIGPGWDKLKRSAYRYLQRHPGRPLRLFYLPPSINRGFDLLSAPYDLRFGDTFYDGAWFVGFDQAETLKRIRCPALLIHTGCRYDDNGILLAAMSSEDARRAAELIPGCRLVTVKSGHDFHDEQPKRFAALIIDFVRAPKA